MEKTGGQKSCATVPLSKTYQAESGSGGEYSSFGKKKGPCLTGLVP
jgi:hypothetical protein